MSEEFQKANFHYLMPSDGFITCAIVGKTGCGKSTLLVDLLLDDYGGERLLTYSRIIILAPADTFTSDSYQKLKIECENRKTNCIFHEVDIAEGKPIPNPNTITETEGRTIIVFDDLMLANDRTSQNTIGKYFTAGRRRFDCFFLSQNYTNIPLRTVRENLNMLIVYKQSKRVIQQIYERFFDGENTKQNWLKFRNFVIEGTQDPFSYITIVADRESTSETGMLRYGLDRIKRLDEKI